MRRLILFFFTLLACEVSAQQTEAPLTPELTVEISPAEALATNAYVQGQIVLKVQLLSRHPFEALELKVPSFPDADVIELQRPRTRSVTGYAGRGVVFETAVAIIPRASGVLTIPSVTAIGMVAPQPGEELHFDLSSDPTDLKVAGVSRHFEKPWWLVSERVEIGESWSTPPDQIRVGEIVQRTVSIRVWGVTAERLPRLEHSRTRGMRVSLADQEFRTEKNADGLIGHAVYTWDLEAEPRPVTFIAPLAVDFWHPLEHRARKAGLPALRIEPLPADSEAIASALMAEAADKRQRSVWVVSVLLGILCVPATLLAGALIYTRIPTRADRKLKSTVRNDSSPEAMYRGFASWLSDTGTPADIFDRNHRARRALATQLFSREQPSGPTRHELVTDALRFSRSRRVSRLLHWLRTL